jgi:hypothetical protein
VGGIGRTNWFFACSSFSCATFLRALSLRFHSGSASSATGSVGSTRGGSVPADMPS